MSGLANNASLIAAFILRQLSSVKLALVIIAALLVGVLVSYFSAVRTTWVLVLPLALLAINLTAVVFTNLAIRRQKGLLIFHIALIFIILLIAAGRLTYLRGTLELVNDVEFDGTLTSSESGPLHRWHLKDVKFVQQGFEIDYAPGTANQGFASDYQRMDGDTASAFPPDSDLTDKEGISAAPTSLLADARGVRRGKTRNHVRWLDDNNVWRNDVIGDVDPLVIQGYQFFTTGNKGYSPTFVWTPNGRTPIAGAINLPSYPVHQYQQHLEWTPPGSKLKLWTQLQFDEVILTPHTASQFRLPEKHTLVIRHGDNRHELQPGDSVKLPGGQLTYQGLSTWMGYNVTHDWTIIWLFGACIVAMGSLTWHFWSKFAARPWQTAEEQA